MSKLTIALGSLMGGKDYCPDCGCDMKSNGTCPECGYGEDDGMDDSEEESNMQDIMDIRDDLQKLVEKLGRIIAKD